MKKQLTIEEFNDLLAKNTFGFISDVIISKEQEHGLHGKMMKDHSTFPSFPIFDDSFYRQSYFNKYIENCLFSYLIRDLTIDLLNIKGINCEKLPKDERNSIHQLTARHGNQPIDSDVDFIIHENNLNIGYIFEEKNKRSQKIEKLMNEFALSKIVYIYTYESSTDCKYDDSCEQIEHIRHRKLFEECGESNKYDYYKQKVHEAIKFATDYINYSSMPVLNNKYLFDFKKELENDLLSLPINNLSYYAIDKYNEKDRMKLQADSLLLTNDIIKDVFIDKKIYKALLGKSDFAKSFITAEYLYKYLSTNNRIDYTAIGVCFIKSIEQLLKSIIYLSFNESTDENRYLIAIKMKSEDFEKIDIRDRNNNFNKKEVLFTSDYEYLFDGKLTLENLCYFIKNNNGATIFSGDDKRILFDCLKAYTNDRNKYLHKGKIESKDTLDLIRENTRYLYVVLLGSAKHIEEEKALKNYLKIVDDNFDKTLSFLLDGEIGKSFVVEYNNGLKFNAILVKDKNIITDYDEDGFIISSPLYFVRVEENMSYSEQLNYAFNNPKKEDVFDLDREHNPIKIWTYWSRESKLIIDNTK